jgi:hypothetical protein
MLSWAREEFWKILPVWIFFFLSFGLLALTRMSIFGEYQIKPSEQPEYLVGSLIMAKVVLLVDALFTTEGWEGRPLIYLTLWNTGLYFLAALVLHQFEQIFTLMRHYHVGFAEANREILRAMEQPTFWTIMISVLVLTFGFCMLRALIRAIGSDRVIEMFFGRRPRRPRAGADDIRRAS